MKVGGVFILVRINKSAQQQLQEKTESGIYLAQAFLDMRYNLQIGTIVEIGQYALEEFPMAAPGDLVVFKHIVEAQEWRLVDKIPNPVTGVDDELRVVDVRSGTEVYAIIKHKLSRIRIDEIALMNIPPILDDIDCVNNGTWFINKNYLFLETNPELFLGNQFSSLLAIPNPNMFLDDDYILKKIELLKMDLENAKQSAESSREAYDFEIKYNAMEKITQEQALLSKLLHAVRYVRVKVAMLAEKTQKETGIQPGSEIIVDSKCLYDMNILGRKFKVTLTELADAILTS